MKVTDHGGLTIRQQFTVQVTDVNEMPTKVELSNNQVSSYEKLFMYSELTFMIFLGRRLI